MPAIKQLSPSDCTRQFLMPVTMYSNFFYPGLSTQHKRKAQAGRRFNIPALDVDAVPPRQYLFEFERRRELRSTHKHYFREFWLNYIRHRQLEHGARVVFTWDSHVYRLRLRVLPAVVDPNLGLLTHIRLIDNLQEIPKARRTGRVDDEPHGGQQQILNVVVQQFLGTSAVISILNWEARLGITSDAAKGLEYLHILVSLPVIHRDFMTNNILLDKSFHAHVFDFELSKLGPEKAGARLENVDEKSVVSGSSLQVTSEKGLQAFTFKQLHSTTGCFSKSNVLGQGAFESVYQGILNDGRKVAIKLMDYGGKQGEEEFEMKANDGKIRPNADAKTPQSKKAKITTPQKTEEKKGNSVVHVATPHPSKKSGKTPASDKTPQSGGSDVSCGSCKRTIELDMALKSHSEAGMVANRCTSAKH